MIDDCRYYLHENKDFLNLLKENGSLIYDYLTDVIRVLNYCIENENKIDDDLSLIFDSGFAYLYQHIELLKSYFSHYFDNDYAKLKPLESLINYLLFLEDTISVLIDKDLYNDIIREETDKIFIKINKMIETKTPATQKDLDAFDQSLGTVTPFRDVIMTIPEIFALVVEEVGLKEAI